MLLCKHNKHLFDEKYWFINELMETAGDMDQKNKNASMYLLANDVNILSKLFLRLFNGEVK